MTFSAHLHYTQYSKVLISADNSAGTRCDSLNMSLCATKCMLVQMKADCHSIDVKLMSTVSRCPHALRYMCAALPKLNLDQPTPRPTNKEMTRQVEYWQFVRISRRLTSCGTVTLIHKRKWPCQKLKQHLFVIATCFITTEGLTTSAFVVSRTSISSPTG